MQNLHIQNKTNTLKGEGLRENNPEYIIIHSTMSYPGFNDLLESHKKRGFAGVGYHYFVSASFELFQARPDRLEGAHALGFNTNSIGIGFYAPERKLNREQVIVGKTLIKDLNARLGTLKVISHTHAQLDYINRLLRENNYDKQFLFDQNVVDDREFERISREVSRYVGTLTTDNDRVVKEKIKSIKNCPGPLFKQLLD